MFNSPRNPLKSLPAAALIAAGIVTASAAYAAGGGGGGGGGSLPSQSAPQYDASAEYAKGVEALRVKDYDAAEKAFKRTLKVVPKNATANYSLGLTYMLQEDYKNARKPLEKAAKYDDAMLDAKRDLAITYHKLGMTAEATETLATLEKLCAGSCAADSDLGKAIAIVKAMMNGGQAQYQPDMDSRLANAASGDGFYVSAVALINEGKYERALAELADAEQSFGPHPDILTYQGFANRKLKNYQQAEEYYQRALAVAPNHLGALEYYGELKIEMGNMLGAKAHLARLDSLCSFGCYEAEELRRWIRAASPS